MSSWAQIEPLLRAKAYRRLDNDPQILLEHDGGPDGLDVDLIYARLLGFEDEIVQDGMQLHSVAPHILLPIPARPIALSADAVGVCYEMEPMRVARYELQSGWATLSVSGEYEPPVEKLRDDFTARVAYLRYRRRS